MEDLDCVVVGAGVVGLAVARELQLQGRDTLVLEGNDRFGEETSTRNSGVVHAGIYYPNESLKATLCVRGRELLYSYCQARSIPHRKLGKLLVAVDAPELETLNRIESRARSNGVGDLDWLDAGDIRHLEPNVHCVGGLLSPSTGIVDVHALMLALLADFESAGGRVVYRSAVSRIDLDRPGHPRLIMADGLDVGARWIINSAGLDAPELAGRSLKVQGALPSDRALYCKGHYYELRGKTGFRHLVYPVPVAGGLGVHLTLDLSGAARFGPDVRWVADRNYDFDDSRRQEFVTAIRRYYPGLDESRLVPGYTGIRPKAVGPNQADADFIIAGPDAHGVDGIINLLGIESPGLTSCLAIAKMVASLLDEDAG